MMKMLRFILSGMFLFLMSGVVLAQSGKIRGVVKDKDNGETIVGANVVIQGTQQGTAANYEGEYIIVGVRPGVYTLEASAIGFSKVILTNVRVQVDLTTTIDFELATESIAGEEITVTAEAPMIQKDVTASLASVSAQQIQALPVQDFSEVLGLQAGVNGKNFRGGRAGEVGYLIDGVPVTDVFSGDLMAGIENNLIEEVQVVTGAFSAEYGQAMSGIVNVTTKDGDNEHKGSFMTFAGSYLSDRSNLFPNIDVIRPTNVRNLEGNIGGPIIKDKMFYFISGRYFGNDGWRWGQNLFTSNDVGLNAAGQRLVLLDTTGSGNGDMVQMDPYERLSLQGKLTWRVTKGVKVSFNTMLGTEDSKEYSYFSRFMPEFQRNNADRNGSMVFKLTHTLNDRTYYDVALSSNWRKFESNAFDDPFDTRYRPVEYSQYTEFAYTGNFRIGGTNNGRFERETNTTLGKFDLTSQINNQNQIKTGVEVRKHKLSLKDLTVLRPLTADPEGGEISLFDNGSYVNEPIEFSAYLQDKIEIGTIIVNAGVRFDYFDSKGVVFEDPKDRATVLSNRDEQPTASTPGFKAASAKYQFSPRLGVAFPISSGGVIHFSYGHFFQIPNFNLLYQNPYFRLNSGGSGLIGLVGNSNLSPQQTINGEIGLKQEINSNTAIEVNLFFRDIRNLAGTAAEPIQVTGTSARYGQIGNTDFGLVRGIIITLNQSIAKNLFATINYTFQNAKGNASDPSASYNAAAANQQLERSVIPLDWDQRHTLNANFSYDTPLMGASFIFNYGSGNPFTPQLSTLQSGTLQASEILYNSEVKPTTWNLDFRYHINLALSNGMKFQLFAMVDNLIDRGNEFGVFGDTGRATYSLQRNVDARIFRGDPLFLDATYSRPDFYNEPRRVVAGLRFNF